MSTQRKDLQFQVWYTADTDEFSVEVISDIIISDDSTNRSIGERERIELGFEELDAAQQALGRQFIAAMQAERDIKSPLVRP